MEASERTAAVFFVGNRLMLDDGVGPAAYDEILAGYDIPENVTLVDVGCMSLDMLPYVERCDLILTVDAVDGTGDAPGTVYRFEPDAMARHSGPEASLHDLKLVDLFDAASLMGYEAEGFCLGMQVGNPSPEQFVVGLTPECAAALPLLGIVPEDPQVMLCANQGQPLILRASRGAAVAYLNIAKRLLGQKAPLMKMR